jgi:hypothetical protein
MQCAKPSPGGWSSQRDPMSGDRGRHLTLVVPGLFGPATASADQREESARQICEGLSLPALERFLSRCTAVPCQDPEPGLAALLFGCFGVVRDGPDWPVAAVTGRLDGAGEDAGWWLRADPVHLRVDLGELALMDSDQLRISADEARALVAELNGQLDDPGVRLEALAGQRWYLRPTQAPRLATPAPWEVSGFRVGEYLPKGEDAGRWQARINDAQMILHASPVNRARERRGEPVINSLWLWGGGHTPRVPATCWQGVWSDSTLVAGLAALAGGTSDALPEDGQAWLARAGSAGNYLLVSSAAYVPVRCSDVEAWRAFVSTFETRWMVPLLEGLGSGQLQSLSLRASADRAFCLRRGRLRHWWRRARPFAQRICWSP